MAEIVKMPKMSDTMEEGVIAVWHKNVGDKVESGELMAEIETDKATMDYESYNDGTVLYLGAAEGEPVAVDGILAIVGEAGEDYQALLDGAASSSNDTPAVQEEAAPAAAPAQSEAIDTSSINAEIVRMPKMSDTMEEGVIAAWLKKVGDTVESGELMAEVETDKATMEYESYNDGTVLYLGAQEGEAVAVDGILAIVGEPGADFETLIKADAQPAVEASVEAPAPVAAAPAPAAEPKVSQPVAVESAPVVNSNSRIKASPLAKRLAEDKGINLNQVQGSGDGGRIVKRDIENFVPAAAPAPAVSVAEAPAAIQLPKVVGEESFEEVRVSQMRKVIAKRLAESKFTAPHFYLTMEINMDKAIEARKSMNEISPVKISFNDMVIKAAAAALRKHPGVNSSWLEDKIRINHHIHIGVAVAVEDGLLVPVLRFADNKQLSHISAEVKELGGKAKSKKLSPDEMTGNTFTISNLGMFGIEEFTAIINPPDACIMAVGGIKQTPIVKDGELTIGNMMKVTLSCDHRVVDGAVGSAFLQSFKGLLEDPVRLLV